MKAKVTAGRSGAARDPLKPYRTKRDFAKTPEPRGEVGAASSQLAFVIQKHAATRLHYDLRLELDGVMLSWAVPKGPSYDPQDRRVAMHVEDHPISYNTFEGTIPPNQYGAGSVIVWDRGTWTPVGDPRKGMAEGKLVFSLNGQKLAGQWELVRIRKPGERQDPWLLFKKRDAYARSKSEYDVVTALPDSVVAKPLGPLALPARADKRIATAAKRPADLAGALKAALPAKLGPQLATATDTLPAGEWIYEIKFDGYRLMARIEGSAVRLFTRRGHDWSKKMPALATELAGLGLPPAWLDGEIVVIGDDGTPDFNALQNAFQRPQASGIQYFVFDVPFFDGYDLRRVALRERRALLKALLDERQTTSIRFSADFDADPASILRSAEKMKLEGLIAKRADATYVSDRTTTWLKLKCRQRQEFVVGGYCDRGGDAASAEIGSLLLGVYDDRRELQFVGGVGTGWDAKTASQLKSRLVQLKVAASPFKSSTAVKRSRWARRAAGAERWVKPQLVAEVSFAGWTPDDQIRHAKFEGLRIDKPAREVVRETSHVVVTDKPISTPRTLSSTIVTHPERVIDPSTGLTKLDLVRYYESVADWMLPHLKGRPCSLVRGPSGINAELFYQKHPDTMRIAGVKALDPSLWPGHDALLELPSARAIVGAAQMNVIEFHTWNAKAKSIDTPDRLIFDLDPGEHVTWKRVQEAALLVRGFLQELDLQAWLKTSGGKGLHLVVPIATRYDWDTARDLSEAVVQQLARVVPDRFVAKSGAANRVGRIYIDFVRNNHGATTVAAYSARARAGLGVSMPVPWDRLEALKSGAQWTIATAREHLSFQSNDPWRDYWKARQSLGRAMKLLKFKPKSPR